MAPLETGDFYKDQVQHQWDQDACGSHYVKDARPDTLEWFLEVERYRYEEYAPWMRELMEFDKHAGEHILEIGAGIGTDHAQFAKSGGIMQDLDLASGHLNLAKRNFELRGLKSTFTQGDAENIPFPDAMFDLVYSNGVIHHTPFRVDKSGNGIFCVGMLFRPRGSLVVTRCEVEILRNAAALGELRVPVRRPKCGESIPFPDAMFDLVYSNGVIHHTPNTARVVEEIYRVLKPGCCCIIMVYAENSLHYWRNLFRDYGLHRGELETSSMSEIMSRYVEISEHGSKPLVKVYTAARLRRMFARFQAIRIYKRQMTRAELPARLSWVPLSLTGRLMGWNLVIKAQKPR